VFFVSVSDVYCKSFRHMLQVFHLNVAKVGTMLHMLRWDPLAITTCLAARALPSGCRHSGEGSCQAPNFGSFVHYVSVPGSVVDTHNSNKIDIKKNHTFIAIGENTLQGSCLHSLGHWPYSRHQSSKTVVLYHRGSIPTGNLKCGCKPYP
jgi:hypothetical protein